MSDVSPAPADQLDGVAEALHRAISTGGPGTSLLWAAAPTALLDHPRAPHPDPSHWHHAQGSVRSLAAAFGSGRGSTVTTIDDVLFAYEGANPAATLEPVIEAVAAGRGADARRHAVRPPIRALARALRTLGAAESAAGRALGAPPPVALGRALQAAVRAHARAGATLAATRPRLVVLASQHSTASRSLLQVARARGIATAYLPHAPVADTYQYRDLPTDFAAVRGEREADFYRTLGAARPLAVVGNPQGSVLAPSLLDPDGPVIFAPRPQAPEVVRAQVAAVAAVAPEVVVSPHPRMRGKAQYQGLWPAHWRVHDGWTLELLRQGYPCLIQLSSGVAWEALAHGVPVIELPSPHEAPPAYLVIREPHVRVCRTDADLGPAVTAARRAAADPDARQRLVAWSEEWCAATGAVAIERVRAWVETCAAAPAPPPGPLLDAWAPRGPTP